MTTTDLSQFVEGTHLIGYECHPVRTLATLKAAMYLPHDPHIEFTTHSNSNPEKITCRFCAFEIAALWETIPTAVRQGHDSYLTSRMMEPDASTSRPSNTSGGA